MGKKDSKSQYKFGRELRREKRRESKVGHQPCSQISLKYMRPSSMDANIKTLGLNERVV